MVKSGTSSRKVSAKSSNKSSPSKLPSKSIKDTSPSDLLTSLEKALKSVSDEASPPIDNELAIHLIRICHQSLGLKATDPPFNAHKDVMLRYIREVFALKNEKFAELEQQSLTIKAKRFRPAVRLWVKNAVNLPSMDADGSCDPYFKAYLPGSSFKPFKSNHQVKQQNPTWNQSFSISIDPELVNCNRGIVFELWDYDSTKCCPILREFRGIRNCSDAYYGVKDLSEWLFSHCFNIELDDRIGSTSIPLNTVPAIEIEVSSPVLNVYGYSVGTINLAMVWGSKGINSLPSKIKAIPEHVKILRHLILWHCKQIILKYSGKFHEMNFDSLDFFAFFYIPALTLINQHRIQINIGHWDSMLILCCVTTMLLTNQVGNDSDDGSNSSCFRAILISLLSTHEVNDRSHRRHENYFIKPLETLRENLFGQLFTVYLPHLPRMLIYILKRDKSSCHFYETLQFLRLFSRYTRLFPNANFRRRINIAISTVIINHVEININEASNWSDLITSLEDFQENVSKCWSQGFSGILGVMGMEKVKEIFENEAWLPIKNLIDAWISNPDRYHSTILTIYFFVKRLDSLFGGLLIEEAAGPQTRVGRVHPLETSVRGIKRRLVLPSDKAIRAGGGLFSNIMSSLGKSTGSWLSKGDKTFGDREMISLLPSSITGITAEAVRGIQTKSSRPTISLNDLEYGQDFRLRDKVQGLGLLRVFPKNLQRKWIHVMKRRADHFVEKTVEEELQAKNVKGDLKSNSRLDSFFYELLACTLYFFVTLEDWGEELFDISISLLLDAIRDFSSLIKDKAIAGVDANSPGSLSLLLLAINDVSIVRGRYLRKRLIETLTDKNSGDIWFCFWSFLQVQTILFDGDLEKETNLMEKISSSDLNLVAKRLMSSFVAIENLCTQMNKIEDRMVDRLAKEFLSFHLEMISATLESIEMVSMRDKEHYTDPMEKFSQGLNNIVSNMISNDVRVNFLLDLKHKLVTNVSGQARFLQECYEKERGEGNQLHHQSRVTRIQIIKLSMIAEGYMETIIQHITKVKGPENVDLDGVLDVSYDFGFDLAITNPGHDEVNVVNSTSKED